MSIQDLANLIKTGNGIFREDPQSGSILKLLAENGFQTKIETGLSNGHTYTIIHNPPSTEFLLVDTWNEGEHPRKTYHAFSVKSEPLKTTPPKKESSAEEHPFVIMLQELNREADELLNLIKTYA